MDNAPRVTAVVVAGAEARALELCLRAALADPWVDELVVVDVGLPAPLAASVRSLKADRRDLTLLRAPGVARAEACNLGAAHARGRWLFFLDPGVVLRRGAAAKLVSAGRRAPAPWVSGGKLLDSKGRERPSVRRGLPTPLTALFGAGRLTKLKLRSRDPATVAAVSGAMLLTPRADFEALGGFDVDGVATLEALDLCRRVGLAGGEVRFTPRAEGVSFAPREDEAIAAEREADHLAAYLRKSAAGAFERGFALATRPLLKAFTLLRSDRKRDKK